MPKLNDDLLYLMTTMFIENIMKTYDLQEMTEDNKLMYLRKVIHYCEHFYDQSYEPKRPAAQNGWLVLRDDRGQKHEVAYRGIWSIEKLKDLLALQFSVKPEDLHLNVVHDSFTSPT